MTKVLTPKGRKPPSPATVRRELCSGATDPQFSGIRGQNRFSVTTFGGEPVASGGNGGLGASVTEATAPRPRVSSSSEHARRECPSNGDGAVPGKGLGASCNRQGGRKRVGRLLEECHQSGVPNANRGGEGVNNNGNDRLGATSSTPVKDHAPSPDIVGINDNRGTSTGQGISSCSYVEKKTKRRCGSVCSTAGARKKRTESA